MGTRSKKALSLVLMLLSITLSGLTIVTDLNFIGYSIVFLVFGVLLY